MSVLWVDFAWQWRLRAMHGSLFGWITMKCMTFLLWTCIVQNLKHYRLLIWELVRYRRLIVPMFLRDVFKAIMTIMRGIVYSMCNSVTFVHCVARWPLYTLWVAQWPCIFHWPLYTCVVRWPLYTLTSYLHGVTLAIRQVFGPVRAVSPPVEVELGGPEATWKSSALHHQVPLLYVHLY